MRSTRNGGQFTVSPLRPPAACSSIARPDPAGPFTLDIGTAERLDMNANGGDDTVTSDAGLDALGFALDIDGGDGNDTLDGGDGADLIKGGGGNDRIVPDDNPAGTRDDARGDAGDDTIVWNGGDDDDLNEAATAPTRSRSTARPRASSSRSAPPTAGRVLFDAARPRPARSTSTSARPSGSTSTLTPVTTPSPPTPASPGSRWTSRAVTATTRSTAAMRPTCCPAAPETTGSCPTTTRPAARHRARRRGDDTIVWNPGDDDDVTTAATARHHEVTAQRGVRR